MTFRSPLLSHCVITLVALVATVDAAVPAGAVKLEPRDFQGLQELLASKRGKIVVLDAWSTFCEPCLKEFHGLVAMHKKYGPDRLACISLCANYSGVGKLADEMQEPLDFLQKQGATFDNIMSSEADEALYRKLKISTVPAILVYDREGKLLKAFEGEPKYSDVEAFVAPLLAK